MKNRLITKVYSFSIIILLGLIYLIWINKTNIYIPCPFHFITGLKCPGCGISLMCISLFDFIFKGFKFNYLKTAFNANPYILIILPFLIYVLLKQNIKWIKTGIYKETKVDKIITYTLLILTVLWGIIRNIII